MKETSWRVPTAKFWFFFLLWATSRLSGGNLVADWTCLVCSLSVSRPCICYGKRVSLFCLLAPLVVSSLMRRGHGWQHRNVQSTNLYLLRENAAGSFTLCCSQWSRRKRCCSCAPDMLMKDISRTTMLRSSLVSCINIKSNYRCVSVQILSFSNICFSCLNRSQFSQCFKVQLWSEVSVWKLRERGKELCLCGRCWREAEQIVCERKQTFCMQTLQKVSNWKCWFLVFGILFPARVRAWPKRTRQSYRVGIDPILTSLSTCGSISQTLTEFRVLLPRHVGECRCAVFKIRGDSLKVLNLK